MNQDCNRFRVLPWVLLLGGLAAGCGGAMEGLDMFSEPVEPTCREHGICLTLDLWHLPMRSPDTCELTSIYSDGDITRYAIWSEAEGRYVGRTTPIHTNVYCGTVLITEIWVPAPGTYTIHAWWSDPPGFSGALPCQQATFNAGPDENQVEVLISRLLE